MVREYHIIYNSISENYSMGHKKYRSRKDITYAKIDDLIQHIKFMIDAKQINKKRKMNFIIDKMAPEEAADKFKSELEKKLKNATFLRKKL